jgi:hypothetical protein
MPDTSYLPVSVEPRGYTRSSFYRDAHLYFAGTVLADDVEHNLVRFHQKVKDIGPLLFDFSDAEYIDIAALINCIAESRRRIEQKRAPAYYAYPQNKRVRDFLKVWRFAEAFQGATQQPFSMYVLKEDVQFLTEEPTSYSGRGDGINALEFNPDWSGQTNNRRNFFEFITFSGGNQPISPEGPFLSAPRLAGRQWSEPSVLEILSKHLGGDSPKADIARVIIYEAISNSIRHPSASVIQIVSKFERGESSDERHTAKKKPIAGILGADTDNPPSSLRICVWDDGDSIPNTLTKAIEEGLSIQAFRLPTFMSDKIFVELRSPDGKKSTRIIDQSEDLSRANANDEWLLLLASLFPGVSRDTSKIVPAVQPYDEGSSQMAQPFQQFLLSAPGMGLYALTRTVLDQFQGSLFLRSSRHRLLIELAHDAYRTKYQVRYKCKITRYPDFLPAFRGNLLTVQLPVRPVASSQ